MLGMLFFLPGEKPLPVCVANSLKNEQADAIKCKNNYFDTVGYLGVFLDADKWEKVRGA